MIIILYNEAIRNARINAGLTQEEVAEKLNVTKMTISKFENGVGTAPSISRLIDLAEVYKVSVDELIGRK